VNFFSNLLKHASQSVLSALISAVGSFAAAVIIARLLGVEGTAAVTMALLIVFLTTTLADVGITGTLARFAAECSGENEQERARLLAAYWLRVLLRAILGGLLLAAIILWLYWGDIISKYARSPTDALVFCGLVLACFVIHILSAFAYQFLRGIRAFGAVALYSGVGTLLQIAGAVIGSLLYGANGALVAYIIFSAPMILGLRRVRLVGAIESPPEAGGMKRYALSFYMAALFSPLLWVRADTLIVDQLIGANAVGLFAAAGTIAALLLQVCQMICNALLPNIVHSARSEGGSFENSSRSAVRLAMSLLLPACLISSAAAPEAVSEVFGPAFAGGGTAAAILCLAGVGSALTLAVGSVLNASNGNGELARNGAIGAVLSIGVGTALASILGLAGAALGRLVSQGIVGLLNIRSANRRVEGLVTGLWLAMILVASAAGALVTEVIGWWLGSGLLSLFLSLAAGGLVYLVAAALLLPLGREERRMMLPTLQRLPAALQPAAITLFRAGPDR
jgi:O-antigen/teichoic acid export membrane protein